MIPDVTSFLLQRSEIVKAAYEPTDEECEWKADEEEELTVSKQVQVTYTPACSQSANIWPVFSISQLHVAQCHPEQTWVTENSIASQNGMKQIKNVIILLILRPIDICSYSNNFYFLSHMECFLKYILKRKMKCLSTRTR